MNNMKTIWTKELCQKEASKYVTKKEFIINSHSAYNKSRSNGWLNEICSHMFQIKKPKEYWTKEKCQDEALKFKTRGEFSKESVSAYSKAWDKDWLDEICQHMKYFGNKFKRCVYVYEFSDKFAYVGLTFNMDCREKQHNKRGPVFQHSKITQDIAILKQLTDYIDIESAKNKESEYAKYYIDNGWKLLNSAKTGACGGGIRKWTKEKCKIEALKYTNVSDFKKKSLAYRAVVRNKWLEELCSHMNRTKKHSGYWTKEKCKEVAEFFSNRKEFGDVYSSAYGACRKNKWLDDVCAHMKKKEIKPKGYWTKERCKEESVRYESRSEFQKKSTTAYQISLRRKWLDEICEHMICNSTK